MNRRILTLAAAGLAATFAVALPLTAAPKGTNHNTSADSVATCDGNNELTIHAPEKLWPPNHKYYTDIYVLAHDPDGETISLTTTGTHSQYDGDTVDSETNGSGHTVGNDITINDDEADLTSEDEDTQVVAEETGAGTVQTDWKARAERSGRIQEGRTYTLSAMATYSDGTCEHSIDFTVPHDMRPSRR